MLINAVDLANQAIILISMQVELTAKLPVKIKKRGKFYVSSCPLLEVYSQGETKARALENIKEALQLFLMSCFERGTLGTVFRERGFKPSTRIVHHTSTPSKYQSVTVPLPLQAPLHVPLKPTSDPLEWPV